MHIRDTNGPGTPTASAMPGESELPLDELEGEITTLAAHINAGSYRWLCLIREFDRREGWAGWGILSCAHWLNWKCGLSLVTAREQLRVAHALAELPLLSDACSEGRISYSQVRALTRIASPDNEASLLPLALEAPAAQLERVVRTYRRLEELQANERAEARHDARYLHFEYDDDGSLLIRVKLPPEEGALVKQAIRAAFDELAQRDYETLKSADGIQDTSAHTEHVAPAAPAAASMRRLQDDSAESFELTGITAPTADERFAQRRADALVRIVESYRAHGTASLPGGERYQVVLHVDAGTLHDASRAGRCEIEDGPALSVETLRRFGCDASVISLVENEDGDPLSVGRKTRSIPPAIRRALRARDDGCRFPGCRRRRFVDGHHVRHWADGGETRLGNLVSLCRHHHRLVHEGGFTVRADNHGGFAFRRPDGRHISAAPERPVVDADGGRPLVELNRRHGLHIDASTAVPSWYGDRLDLDSMLFCLYQSEARH